MNKKGFTLVELVLFMGLFSIMIVILTQIFIAILNVQLETKTSTSIDQEGDYLLARLASDISQTQTINIPVTLGASSPTMQLTLRDASVYTYTLSGNVIQLNDGTNTYNLNSSESTISNLSFVRLGKLGGKNSIKIHFTVTSTTRNLSGVGGVKDFDTTMAIR